MSTDKKTIDWYNQNAHIYTAHLQNQTDSVYHAYYEKPAMYSLVPDIKEKHVLSLGCGSGEDSKYLKSFGAKKSIGIDISKNLIKIAQINHPECEFYEMNMEQLDFTNDSFDFVYSSLALHYIEDWTIVFQEVFRVLKPNTYFLFSCQHPIISAMMSEKIDENKSNKLIGICKNDGKQSIVGDYLNHHKSEKDDGDMAVTTWHKSFSEIINIFTSNGFLLDKIIEPKPLIQMKNISIKKYERLNKIPEFIIFRIKKTNI